MANLPQEQRKQRLIQQNRLKREKSLLTFPEWEMFLSQHFSVSSAVKNPTPSKLLMPMLFASIFLTAAISPASRISSLFLSKFSFTKLRNFASGKLVSLISTYPAANAAVGSNPTTITRQSRILNSFFFMLIFLRFRLPRSHVM